MPKRKGPAAKKPPARKRQPPLWLVSEETGQEATNKPEAAGQGDDTKMLLATLVQCNQAMAKQMEALTKIVENFTSQANKLTLSE